VLSFGTGYALAGSVGTSVMTALFLWIFLKGNTMGNQLLDSTVGILAVNAIRREMETDVQPSAGAAETNHDQNGVLQTIRKRMKSSVYIAIRSIDVQCIEGKLYFRGVVPTFYTKQVLLSLAEDLAAVGVIEIVDETIVMKY
jgi:hypothetical protein